MAEDSAVGHAITGTAAVATTASQSAAATEASAERHAAHCLLHLLQAVQVPADFAVSTRDSVQAAVQILFHRPFWCFFRMWEGCGKCARPWGRMEASLVWHEVACMGGTAWALVACARWRRQQRWPGTGDPDASG